MVRAILPLIVLSLVPAVPAQRSGRAVPKAAPKVATDVQCPADLGRGVKSKRAFCDIVIGTDPAQGIVMRIPPHAGPTTLKFDLHNRFAVAARTLPFARQAALVAVLNGANGAAIDRAAVVGELRAELDLFDRLSGTGPGGTKTIAPGRAQPVSVPIPASVSIVSLVGVRLEVTDKDGRQDFASAGRPVAIGSNFRIEYTPAAVGK